MVLLGIAGLILPIMPGWIFLIPGLIILGDYFPPAKRLVDWLKARYGDVIGSKPKNGSGSCDPEGDLRQ